MSFSPPPAQVNLNRPMQEVLAQLSSFPIRTRLSLTGTLVVARDIAHAKLQVRLEWEGAGEVVERARGCVCGASGLPVRC